MGIEATTPWGNYYVKLNESATTLYGPVLITRYTIVAYAPTISLIERPSLRNKPVDILCDTENTSEYKNYIFTFEFNGIRYFQTSTLRRYTDSSSGKQYVIASHWTKTTYTIEDLVSAFDYKFTLYDIMIDNRQNGYRYYELRKAGLPISGQSILSEGFDFSTIDEDLHIYVYLYYECKDTASNRSYLFRDDYLFSSYLAESAPVMTNIFPNNDTINIKKNITFKWKGTTSLAKPLYGYDLEYSYDNITWQELAHVSSVGNNIPVSSEYTTNGKIFDAGVTYWRIRAYNWNDKAGEWSAAFFIGESPLLPPDIIETSETPHLTIRWTADDQIAFRLIAGDYDSGAIFSPSQSFTIPKYFSDGEIIIKVAIANSLGRWSEYAETTVNIQNQSGEIIELSVKDQDNSSSLTWSTQGQYKVFYILRDGIQIAKTHGHTFVDTLSNGKTIYQILGAFSDGYYTLSNEVLYISTPEHAIISSVDQIDWIPLVYKRGDVPEISDSFEEDISYQFYSGRNSPIPYSARFTNVEKLLGFTVSREIANRIRYLIGKIVIYKDYSGERIIGILNSCNISGKVSRPDISFTITQIDYEEEIEYDE